MKVKCATSETGESVIRVETQMGVQQWTLLSLKEEVEIRKAINKSQNMRFSDWDKRLIVNLQKLLQKLTIYDMLRKRV